MASVKSISVVALMQCVLADAWVVPVSLLGKAEIHCRTHLGHLLRTGDTAWGFDFTRANINNPHLDKMKSADIPDVVSLGICSLHISGYYLRILAILSLY